jgi:hypothetical protein
MPPKKSRKAAPTALVNSIESIRALEVILGEQDNDELGPSSPSRAAESCYPEPPPPPHTEPIEESESEEDDKENKLAWSEEMLEQLVEELYDVFIKGGGSDNSFKKSTFQSVTKKVKQVYNGKIEITYAKCKNKWADLKRKWHHWIILSKQSRIGWVEENELYDFFDYVWEGLNKSYPKIIWHKTHVMPFRDLIGSILHDVQANGEESFSFNKPTTIDPRLRAMDTARSSATESPDPSFVSRTAKTLYNKSKKRPYTEPTNDSEDDTLAPAPKRVDLAGALIGLSEEMARGRKAKEEHLTNHQKALKLLEKEYKKRMDIMAFIQAWDRWLEIELPTELSPL